MTADPKAEFLAKAKAGPVDVPISDLLAFWGYRTRNWESVGQVGLRLKENRLVCEPRLDDDDLAQGAILRVGPKPEPDQDMSETTNDPDDQSLRLPPNPIRVGAIPGAHRPVERVPSDRGLDEVHARMARDSCSLLAVVSGDQNLVGAVSWEIIAKARARGATELEKVMLKPAPEAQVDDDVLQRIGLVKEHGFFYVRDTDGRICGLVTATDLTAAYQNLLTPYFQLGEIERRLRDCIDKRFSKDEIRAACTKNKPKSVEKMMFYDYLELLGDDGRWAKMKWEVNHLLFMAQLDRTRVVRNKIMHFGEALTADDQKQIENLLNYMRFLDQPR